MVNTNSKKGFTLIELIVVISVVAVLSGVLISSLSIFVADSKIKAALADMESSASGMLLNESGGGILEDVIQEYAKYVLYATRYYRLTDAKDNQSGFISNFGENNTDRHAVDLTSSTHATKEAFIRAAENSVSEPQKFAAFYLKNTNSENDYSGVKNVDGYIKKVQILEDSNGKLKARVWSRYDKNEKLATGTTFSTVPDNNTGYYLAVFAEEGYTP